MAWIIDTTINKASVLSPERTRTNLMSLWRRLVQLFYLTILSQITCHTESGWVGETIVKCDGWGVIVFSAHDAGTSVNLVASD
ncbi:hypothetical protein BLNAU_24296 [Blattamonas nauphoetae]|uniref:Uncharacterized protein n=1 Tax=Blattamonas nauphoetae TaxID=2049346 RepID=A0ABQ9WMT4_9EUKA|nr:hypothetical protein BLNAU_24296 [Blattamonas nauphoetae]